MLTGDLQDICVKRKIIFPFFKPSIYFFLILCFITIAQHAPCLCPGIRLGPVPLLSSQGLFLVCNKYDITYPDGLHGTQFQLPLLLFIKFMFNFQRNPKMELSKQELLKLLSYLEGELEAREVVIAALKVIILVSYFSWLLCFEQQ